MSSCAMIFIVDEESFMVRNIDYIFDPSYQVRRYYWHRGVLMLFAVMNLIAEMIIVVIVAYGIEYKKVDLLNQG